MRATTTLLLALPAWLGITCQADAQSGAPELARLDLHASVGWAHVQRSTPATTADWDHGVWRGAAGVGWYWTDHVKTDVEVNTQSKAEYYRYVQVATAGQAMYQSSRALVRSSGIGVTQVFQFFRNAWVHPFVGAGIDIRRETSDEAFDPVVVYDYTARQPRLVEPGRDVGPLVAYRVEPVVVAGIKAYLSERAFFRSDLRVNVRRGANEVAARAGFGLDF